MPRLFPPLIVPFLVLGACNSSAPHRAVPWSTPEARTSAEAPPAATEEATVPAALASTPLASASRKVIHTVSLRLRAHTPADALDAARSFTLEHGGFVDRSDASGANGSASTVEATFRVPAGALEAAIGFFRGLGAVLRTSETGEDVTEQLVDLDARLLAKRELEARLIALAGRAGAIEDLLRVEQELARVRGDIEAMQARQRTMAESVAFATVHLTIEAPVQPLSPIAQSFGSRLANAWSTGIRRAGNLIVAALELGISGAPLLMMGALMLASVRRSRRRRAVRAAPGS